MDISLFNDFIHAVKPKERVCVDCGKNCKTPRACLITQIMLRINLERVGTKFKPVSYMAVQRKLAHLSDSDIQYTNSICKDSANRTGSYSKCFFGCLKIK